MSEIYNVNCIFTKSLSAQISHQWRTLFVFVAHQHSTEYAVLRTQCTT